nr:MAG TPA: hypothetical protein [Caudoviricetes sp.]DAJ27363.1 MAG TPA: hypothetical protein [Caudoviricetes sp.]
MKKSKLRNGTDNMSQSITTDLFQYHIPTKSFDSSTCL